MKKRNSSKIKFKSLLTIIAILIILILAYRFLKISQIDCFSQFGPCPEEINQHLNHYIGRPLLSPLPQNQIKQDLMPYPQIKTISLYRRLPTALVVAILLRRPIGAIGPSVLGAQVVADQEGFVFQKISQSSLPTLIQSELPKLSSKISTAQLQSLNCLNLISGIFDTQVSGILDRDILTISAPTNMQIVVNVAQPTSNWYTPLQLIIHRSKINAKMPHKIDLRFSDSVITY